MRPASAHAACLCARSCPPPLHCILTWAVPGSLPAQQASWFSPDAADLLGRMLTMDPEARITLEGVWAHPWVAKSKCVGGRAGGLALRSQRSLLALPEGVLWQWPLLRRSQ